MKKIQLIFLALSCVTCIRDKPDEIEIIKLDKVFVSYYPSSSNYDIDSIKVKWIDSLYLGKIEKISVYLKDSTRFTPQKMVPRHSSIFINDVWNGAAKPFWWEAPFVDNFSLPLDSVRSYLKNYIIKNNTFFIYLDASGKQKVILNDTNAIVLKELYGGL